MNRDGVMATGMSDRGGIAVVLCAPLLTGWLAPGACGHRLLADKQVVHSHCRQRICSVME